VPAAHTNRLFAATAAAIYATVFVGFLLFESPGLGVGHFYYLAIALVALGFGPIWGAAAGALATGLYTVGVLLSETMPTTEIFTLSTPIRFVNYVAIGTLLGWFATHYRAANAELQVLAQRDLVTGLPNTRAFELAIDRRLAAEPLRERLARHLRLVGVPARGPERPHALPRRRRAPLRPARAARPARAGRPLARL